MAGYFAYQSRIAVRNVRCDGMDKVKKLKSEQMSDDDAKLWSEEIQNITDSTILMIDNSLEEKQSEIMQIWVLIIQNKIISLT